MIIIQQAEDALAYQFKDRALLHSALSHASYAPGRVHSNERLEFFGDAILGMVVCEELYRRFPDLLEGEMTKIKSAVVSRRTCAKIARRRKFDACVLLGKGLAEQSEIPASLAAAIYESLIGAIYLDGGLEPVRAFILQDMIPEIQAAADSENQQNYKSHLQQHVQKHLMATPLYEVLDEKGPDHSKSFEVCVVVAGRRFAGAWGPSKKEAEQKAAFNALRELDVIDEPLEETE